MLRNILAFSYLAVLSMSFPLDITLLWDQLSTAELCANEQLVARAVLTPFLKCRAASVVLSPAVLIQFVLGHEVTCGIAILIIFSFYTRYDIQVYIEKHKFVCILYIDVRGMLLQYLSKRVNFFDKLWARNKQTSNERPTVHAQSTGTHSSPHGWAQQAKLAN